MDIEHLKIELRQAREKLDAFEQTAKNMQLELSEKQKGFLLGKRHTFDVLLARLTE